MELIDWSNGANSEGLDGGVGRGGDVCCGAGAVGCGRLSEMDGIFGISFLKSTIIAGGRLPDLGGMGAESWRAIFS